MYRRTRKYNILCHDSDKLQFDEACLDVVNTLNTKITMKQIPAECYKCDMVFWRYIEPKDSDNLQVNIAASLRFGFDFSNGSSCNKTHTFKQHGEYRWVADLTCQEVEEIHPPGNPYTPIFIIFGICLLIYILYKLVKLARKRGVTRKLCNKLRRRRKKSTAELSTATTGTTGTDVTVQTSEASIFLVPQVLCFQVFRGLVILSMILFRGESSRFWFMKNSPWNGIMPADFVYPWFLWGTGAVFYLKYRYSMLLLGLTRLKTLSEVFIRSLKYVSLGVCMNSFEIIHTNRLRFPGQLQRCGVLHLVCFSLEIACIKKKIEIDKICEWKFPDRCIQYIFIIVCLVSHALITYLLPVPGCPTGYIGPGGVHMYSKHWNCTGGAARYVDRIVLGNRHLDRYPICRNLYNTTVPFDSEGLLGTLNSFLTMYSGIYAAGVFVYHSKTKVRIAILVLCGIIQSLLGLSLCLFSKEGGVPLNKSLWSLSFALLTSGVAFLVLALLYVIVDVYRLWLGSPLFEAGLNTMLLYVGHVVLRFSMPFSWVPVNMRYYTEFVIMDVITLSFWIIVSKLAYKRSTIIFI